MNPGLNNLQPYPFERLRMLFESVPRSTDLPIALTIGEPQHAPPPSVLTALSDALHTINKYPATSGSVLLRQTIADWLISRFSLQGIDADHQILPVNGTREALFAIAQALVTPGAPSRVICPNPFYQIYEGAALLAGTTPLFVPATKESNFLPDFSVLKPDDWEQCELLYLCTPGNPSGAVMPIADLQALIALAQQYNFVIASDECYSEIYPDNAQPPTGLLQAAATMGNHDFERCLVFHSLSKRSNLPGLRSGFVAGDANLVNTFLRYRTYHGCAMPPHHQQASIAAWGDETHVIENRASYTQKFNAVVPILTPHLDITMPEAGFYLWPHTPYSDEQFAIDLLTQCNVAVLPGRYLGREVNNLNPGTNHIRMALVAELEHCVAAAERIATAMSRGW